MTVEKIKLEDFKGGIHPFQSRYWAEVKRETHWSNNVFSVNIEGINYQFLLLLRPFIKGKFVLAYFPFAPSPEFFKKEGNLSELSLKLKELLPNNVVAIRYDLPFNFEDTDFNLDDYIAFAKREKLILLKDSVQPEGTVVVDLTSGYNEVSKLYRTRARRTLKKNIDNVIISTYLGDETEFFDWYGVYRETAQKDGFTARDKTYLRSMLNIDKEDGCHAKLYLAKVKGKIKGGIIVLSNANYSIYLFGASLKSQKFNVSYSLQDYAIRDSIAMGKKFYDFYGISGLKGREQHLEGLKQFKKSFGGKVLYRVPTADFVLKRRVWSYYTKLEHLRYSKYRNTSHRQE